MQCTAGRTRISIMESQGNPLVGALIAILLFFISAFLLGAFGALVVDSFNTVCRFFSCA